ncbi:MAG TPA: polymer-forming cytoskeletal protein [Stellaceae bacterium]|jgi:cytoskeletal protein CcmA (bactofilin family)
MAIFSRGKKSDEGELATMESDSELDLPVKPASRPGAGGPVPARPHPVPPVGPGDNRATESRGNAPRSPENKPMEGKVVAEIARPADMARRLVDAPNAPPAPSSRSSEPELRKLTVGREISLQGDITHCDQLVVEGSVTANLSCQEVAIMESGVLKGTVEIGSVEVRGLFEGTLNVSGRLLIRSTGRVVGKVRYGQIEIEIGGQISGEVEASPPAKNASKNSSANVGVPAGVL